MEYSLGSPSCFVNLLLQTSLVSSIKYTGGIQREQDGSQVSSWDYVGLYPLGYESRYGSKRNQ